MGTSVIVLFFRRPPAQEQSERSGGWLATQAIGRWMSESHLSNPPAGPAMIRLTRLPEEVARRLAPLKPYFSYRHYLGFCWLLVAPLVCFEKATLQALSRHILDHVAAWHLWRLLAAGRWQWARVLEWLVSQALAAVPPPRDGVLPLVVDSTLKGKRNQPAPSLRPLTMTIPGKDLSKAA